MEVGVLNSGARKLVHISAIVTVFSLLPQCFMPLFSAFSFHYHNSAVLLRLMSPLRVGPESISDFY